MPKSITKNCLKCGVEKKLSEFPAKAGNKDGLDNRCRACERIRSTEKSRRRRLNAEVRAADREYQKQRSGTAERQAWLKEYRASEHGKAIRLANKHQRRAAIEAAVPQRWKKSACSEKRCYWCGVYLSRKGIETHLEHLMPISLGGEAKDYNEAPACSSCNLAKSNQHPLVWIASFF